MIELPEHYDSIDTLPMLNWNNIHKKQDMIYLLVKPCKLGEEQIIELQKVWEIIYKEFINTFGFSDQFNDIVNQKLKIAKLQKKHIITGDDSIMNFIRSNEKVLAGIESRTIKNDIYETKQIIEKHFGIRIPMAECTVHEFYSYLKSIKK